MSIPNYDQEIEKMYHPENFEDYDEMDLSAEKEYRKEDDETDREENYE